MKKLICFVSLFGASFSVLAQKITPEEYIDVYKDLAIREMKRMGIPASVTLAQGILESESGNSELVKKSNNHFGIKCKSTWTAGGVSHDDDLKGECFRVYKKAEDSYRDHSNFLRGNQRYGFLFQLDPADYTAWANGLKKAGYATNPKYPQLLISYIEKYNLNQYTLSAINEVAAFDGSKYTDDANTRSTIPIGEKPPAIIYFNDLKALYVQKGTAITDIASQQGISVETLRSFNDLKDDVNLLNEQWIFLQEKAEEGKKDFYTVQEDESLYDVAQNNGIKLASILKYNNLPVGDLLKPGTQIKLRSAVNRETNPEGVSSEPSSKGKHVVQPKEGLYAIAKKYNVTVQQIKAWNNFNSDDIMVGQEVIVSQIKGR